MPRIIRKMFQIATMQHTPFSHMTDQETDYKKDVIDCDDEVLIKDLYDDWRRRIELDGIGYDLETCLRHRTIKMRRFFLNRTRSRSNTTNINNIQTFRCDSNAY